MKTYALRLRPNQDLKEELIKFAKDKNLRAGLILTCVGSLKHVTLRMAGADVVKHFEGGFEITSLVGTLAKEGVHLHISLSDKNGDVVGGHLKEGCLVHTTAEVVIGDLEDIKFSREFDEQTGFKELVVSKR